MKKILIALLLGSSLGSLVSCENSNQNKEKSSTNEMKKTQLPDTVILPPINPNDESFDTTNLTIDSSTMRRNPE